MHGRESVLAILAVVAVSCCFAEGKAPEPVDTLNAVLAERAAKISEARKLERDSEMAFLDAANTSPEIDALRKEIEDLKQRLMQAQHKLREKVEGLPKVKESRERAAKLKKEASDLEKKAEELIAAKEKLKEQQAGKEPKK
jgi:TolA-binding protein